MGVSGEVILRGLHWASGILTEIVGDYGNVMPTAARDLLRESLANLHEAQDEIRRCGRGVAVSPQLKVGTYVTAGEGDDCDVGEIVALDGERIEIMWSSGLHTQWGDGGLSVLPDRCPLCARVPTQCWADGCCGAVADAASEVSP